MLKETLKNLFLRGKYADQIILTTTLTLIFLILLALTYFLPPAGFLILPLFYYTLKYLWFYDGVTLSPILRLKWRNLKIPEKAGLLGAFFILPFILGISLGLKRPSWHTLPLVLFMGLFVSFAVILEFYLLPEEKREEQLSLGDFFIAGWTAGVLVGTFIFFAFLASASFFILGFMALFALILALFMTLLTGYIFKNLRFFDMVPFLFKKGR